MRLHLGGFLALLCCEALLFASLGCGHRATPPAVTVVPPVFRDLQQDLAKPYLTLFEIAPKLEYSAAQVEAMRKYLNEAKDYCVGQFQNRANQYAKTINELEKESEKSSSNASYNERNDLHCKLQNTRILELQAKVLANQAIPVAYQNKEAKLRLIQEWPNDLRQIKQELATGVYKSRQWGDVQDIGFREIAAGQQDDIKAGQDAIRDMRESGLMPPMLQNKAVVDYVTGVAQKIASHSDLHVPLHVTVLNAKDINAFALPGGFLFVNRGLLEAADNESELAGVIAHEISHDVARHGHKLMVRATVTSIFFQAAEVAGLIFAGGITSLGLYYALEYGFQGLGLLLNLNLLGISREYELEADKLGVQYAWNSGYDPNGFIEFFDKMATREGYVDTLSWFYDHPPFYERMKDAEREILFLPKKPGLVDNTAAFAQMKTDLKGVTAVAEEEEKNRPSLVTPVQGCPPPPRVPYRPGEPIEAICSLPGANYRGENAATPQPTGP